MANHALSPHICTQTHARMPTRTLAYRQITIARDKPCPEPGPLAHSSPPPHLHPAPLMLRTPSPRQHPDLDPLSNSSHRHQPPNLQARSPTAPGTIPPDLQSASCFPKPAPLKDMPLPSPLPIPSITSRSPSTPSRLAMSPPLPIPPARSWSTSMTASQILSPPGPLRAVTPPSLQDQEQQHLERLGLPLPLQKQQQRRSLSAPRQPLGDLRHKGTRSPPDVLLARHTTSADDGAEGAADARVKKAPTWSRLSDAEAQCVAAEVLACAEQQRRSTAAPLVLHAPGAKHSPLPPPPRRSSGSGASGSITSSPQIDHNQQQHHHHNYHHNHQQGLSGINLPHAHTSPPLTHSEDTATSCEQEGALHGLPREGGLNVHEGGLQVQEGALHVPPLPPRPFTSGPSGSARSSSAVTALQQVRPMTSDGCSRMRGGSHSPRMQVPSLPSPVPQLRRLSPLPTRASKEEGETAPGGQQEQQTAQVEGLGPL
uniref:Uncharacterized protein n=1 Tax=Dunaliella tertiolecta TaxID=3047 RepID=A0A7S3QKH6_DUNTE